MASQSSVRFSAVTALAIALSGCATPKDIAEQALKVNYAVETAGNQMLLLNVLRAVHQRPMHFTAISKVSGPLGGISPSTQISIPFGPDFKTQIYTLTPTLKADVPVFDVAPLDTQEFLRGITTPIPVSLMKYYLDQGWPVELALTVFVRKIDFYSRSDITKDVWVRDKTSVVNYPPDKTKFDKFQEAIGGLFACGMEIEARSSAIGPALDKSKLEGAVQVSVAKEKLGLHKLGATESWEMRRAELDHYVVFYMRSEKICEKSVWQPFIARSTESKGGAQLMQLDKNTSALLESSDRKHRVVAYLRSPEAMLYYMGEVARAMNREKDPYTPKVKYRDNPDKDPAPVTLFALIKSSDDKQKVAAEVNYEGERYVVPLGDAGGQSMHVLSLVSQIIGLQKKGTDLPTTSTVRLVGQ